jgi:hypothetical protein
MSELKRPRGGCRGADAVQKPLVVCRSQWTGLDFVGHLLSPENGRKGIHKESMMSERRRRFSEEFKREAGGGEVPSTAVPEPAGR